MNRITKASTGIADNIKDNFKLVSHTVKEKVTFHHEYSKDDELLEHYQHDLEKSISGLKFVKNQTKRLGLRYWPNLLKSNKKLVDLFLRLLGSESLHFKGIEEYYEDFDKYSALSEIPLVHPKEKELLISSVNEELINYRATIDQLSFRLAKDWEIHIQQVKLRVDEMNGYLRDTLKVIKKRNVKKIDYNRTHHKIDKLQKKTTPLTDKEHEKLNKLDSTLRDEHEAFETLDNKLKTILPHVLSFLDEFVDDLAKLVLCQQIETFQEVLKTLKDFSTHHGFLGTIETDFLQREQDIQYNRGRNDFDLGIQDYENIIEKWESSVTSTRIQIESFITAVHNKNPDLIDKEIDEADKTSKVTKVWNKVNQKVTEKSHKVKPKDHVNGVFSEDLSTDPLRSFQEFHDSDVNKSETYHPFRKVDIDDVLVPEQFVRASELALPALPPRSNTKPLPSILAYKVNSPLPPTPHPNSVPPPLPSRPTPITRYESTNSLNTEEDYDDDASSIMSDSSTHSVSTIASDILIQNSTPTLVAKNLKKIYNKSKNNISSAPVPDFKLKYDIHPKPSDLFERTSTTTYKLERINHLFERILVSSEAGQRKLIAKFDFEGTEAGDLSFKEGDEIEVLCDFQTVATLYSSDEKHWLIGKSSGKGDNYRIGFIPSNYFA